MVVFTLAGLLLSMNQAFFWNLFGVPLLTHAYLYFMLACFLSIVFIIFPATRAKPSAAGEPDEGAPAVTPLAWYDVGLFGLTIVVTLYFGSRAEEILNMGWDYAAPALGAVFSVLLWGLAVEALRRTAGSTVAVIAFLFSVYPMFSSRMPLGFLQGISHDFRTTAQIHAVGVEGILGLPLQTAASILIGFLLFGVVLLHCGGSAFFHDLAQSLLGGKRGGAAKVSVASSASMGMMSGSAVSNVLTTGPMTIPAMIKSGFSARYAAAVEATASSGGSITPPVMGTVAFLMISFIGVPYREILIAATIPAILYYVGIYLQIDAYSAKKGLRGLPKDQLPDFKPVIRSGWPYLAALVMLTTLLVVTTETQAPYWVAGALVVFGLFKKNGRLTASRLVDMVFDCGKTISEILGIIAGVGLIVGGLSMSGVTLSLARELLVLVGDNVVLMLVAGAITCFILGMGMTVSAAYVFLAIVMVPAVVEVGVDPIAAHLFVVYWAAVSYITPPVALASFAAAGIARSDPMKTSLSAMKLGAVKYVVPFGFALNPALVAQAPLPEVLMAFALSLVGVYALACAFEGWMLGLNQTLPPYLRLLAGLGGVSLIMPGVLAAALGGALLGSVLLCALLARRRGENMPPADVAETKAQEPVQPARQ
ncbi:TRAP transporter permease [Arthrobacter sp. KK5.5]|uniref:TRAP transporter permease n=1 Tax=Arthrobacter sp. KK5.5 TaxID=3373084 RepID=UPI003EE4A5B2